jgi:hypothetical protein
VCGQCVPETGIWIPAGLHEAAEDLGTLWRQRRPSIELAHLRHDVYLFYTKRTKTKKMVSSEERQDSKLHNNLVPECCHQSDGNQHVPRSLRETYLVLST